MKWFEEIQNASLTPSESNQQRNLKPVQWEFRNISTQPLEINDKKSETIAFVINSGIKVTANNFYICKEIRNKGVTLWDIGDVQCNNFTQKTKLAELSALDHPSSPTLISIASHTSKTISTHFI